MMSLEAAADCGVTALAFLAERPEDFLRFLSATGAEIPEVRARAQDPEFLGFVLDFVLAEEELARGFCETAERSPEDLAQARAALPGGALPNWT